VARLRLRDVAAVVVVQLKQSMALLVVLALSPAVVAVVVGPHAQAS
jgi:hypothetical protein